MRVILLLEPNVCLDHYFFFPQPHSIVTISETVFGKGWSFRFQFHSCEFCFPDVPSWCISGMLGEAVSGTTSRLPFQTHQFSQQSSNGPHYVGISGSLTHTEVLKSPSQMLTFVIALCPLNYPWNFRMHTCTKHLLVYFPEIFLCFNVTVELSSTNLRC